MFRCYYQSFSRITNTKRLKSGGKTVLGRIKERRHDKGKVEHRNLISRNIIF